MELQKLQNSGECFDTKTFWIAKIYFLEKIY